MTLVPGTRLGPYEIVAGIGAGGMGEVYRARDTRLNRDVAIKILPDSFAADPERIARFQREAQVLASLNHPNIAQIYGVEQTADVRALVLEFVDGPTLADRIALGPVPLDEALHIAKQVADALEAAHDLGIIHRDLKPANIKLRPDGAVKVLDFGLAKALVADASNTSLSMSPTITSPVMTGQGMILGSAAYMSPEQARGKSVDKRSDVWAFGCMLYEMLTGRRAFDGDEVTDVLAFIITKDPDLAALPAKTPPVIRKLLTRCFVKDRKKRLADISDARLEIDEAIAAPEALRSANARTGPSRRALIYSAAAGIVCAALTGIIVWRVARPAPAAGRPLQKLTIHIPAQATYLGGTGGDLAVSRDGTRLAFAAMDSGRRVLYIRELAELEPQTIRGSEGGFSPFFSPDGDWVGFFTEPGPLTGKLKKVPVRGGLATTLCDAPSPNGGVWLDDDTIIFSASAPNQSSGGLFKCPVAGGQSVPVTTLDPGSARHGWPDVLPDGKSVLFSILPRGALYDSSRIAVYSLVDGSTKTIVTSGYHGKYVSSGHIVYVTSANAVSASNLMAVPFDIDRLRATGAPVPVVEGLMTGARTVGSAGFDVSPSGFLVYAPGAGAARRSLVWVDRQGREEPIAAPSRAYVYARLSPDGTRVVLDVRDEQSDVWVWSLARQTLTRVTKDPGIDRFPVWNADGTRVFYSSPRSGAIDNIYSHAADGTGEPERIIESQTAQRAETVTADGSQLIFRDGGGGTAASLGAMKLLSLTGKRTVLPLMQPPASETNAELSPDGKWLAYQSSESSRDEVYVRPFPNVNGAKFLVSTGGGSRPLWARSGRELFYLSGSTSGPLAVMAVPVELGTTFSARTSRKVFEGRYVGLDGAFVARSYDVSPDGTKFLMIKDETADTSSTQSAFVILLNFFDELKRLALPNP